MQKIKKIIAALLVLSMMILGACAKKEEKTDVKDYYDNSANISVNIASEEILSFDMVFFTKEKVDEVEVLNLIGDDINNDTFQISLMNNTADIYRNHKYKSLYCSDWLIDCKSDKDNAEYKINGIVLKINGEVRRIDFGKPLEYINKPGNDIFDEELQVMLFSNEFPSSMINSGEFAGYQFVANEKMKIEKIHVGNNMNTEVKLFLNDDKITEYSLPVEVEAGTKVNMEIAYNSDELNKFSYVLTNLYVTYSIDGQQRTRKGAMQFSPTSPVDNKLTKIDSLIDFVIS